MELLFFFRYNFYVTARIPNSPRSLPSGNSCIDAAELDGGDETVTGGDTKAKAKIISSGKRSRMTRETEKIYSSRVVEWDIPAEFKSNEKNHIDLAKQTNKSPLEICSTEKTIEFLIKRNYQRVFKKLLKKKFEKTKFRRNHFVRIAQQCWRWAIFHDDFTPEKVQVIIHISSVMSRGQRQ